MERRFILAALAVAIAGALPAARIGGDGAQRTAADDPASTSRPPSSRGRRAPIRSTSPDGLPRPGACTTPPAAGSPSRRIPATRPPTHFADTRRRHVLLLRRAGRRLLATANGPGLTAQHRHDAAHLDDRRLDQARRRLVQRRRHHLAQRSDATSGVATSPCGSARSAPARRHVVPMRWDTTRFTDGTYDVCNVVTDRAGYTTTATLTVTIANAVPSRRRSPPARPAATRGSVRRPRHRPR